MTPTSIFERRRDGTKEDRRTWALFLSFCRSKEFLHRFVVDALKILELGVGDDPAVTAKAWPRGFGRGQPDGLLQRGEEWQVIFEAKVPGNPLWPAQVKRYLREAEHFPGRRAFVAYLDDEDVDAGIKSVWDEAGVTGLILPHRCLLSLLASWGADTDLDPVAAFLARELHDFFVQETGMTTLDDLRQGDLHLYSQHSATVHEVDTQVRERLGRIAAALNHHDLCGEVTRKGRHWLLTTSACVGHTPFTVGVTLSLDMEDGRLGVSRWVHGASCDIHGIQAVRDAGTLPPLEEGMPSESDEDGVLWWEALPATVATAFTEALEFPKAKQAVIDAITGLVNATIGAWPRFVGDYFEAVRPHDYPEDVAGYLRSWLSGEAAAGREVAFEDGQISVGDRGGRGDKVELYWRGSTYFRGDEGDCLTVWANAMNNLRAVHGAPDWSELQGEGNWRHVSIRTVTQLQRILGSIS